MKETEDFNEKSVAVDSKSQDPDTKDENEPKSASEREPTLPNLLHRSSHKASSPPPQDPRRIPRKRPMEEPAPISEETPPHQQTTYSGVSQSLLDSIHEIKTSLQNLGLALATSNQGRNEQTQMLLNVLQQENIKFERHNEQMHQVHMFYANQQQQNIYMLGQVLEKAVEHKRTVVKRHEIDETNLNQLGDFLKLFTKQNLQEPVADPLPPEKKAPTLEGVLLKKLELAIIINENPATFWNNLPYFIQNLLMQHTRHEIDEFLAEYDLEFLKEQQSQAWLHTFYMFLEALQTNENVEPHPFENRSGLDAVDGPEGI